MELLQQQVNDLQQQMELLKLAIERLPAQMATEISSLRSQRNVQTAVASHHYGSSDDSMEGILLDEDMSAERGARAAATQDMPPRGSSPTSDCPVDSRIQSHRGPRGAVAFSKVAVASLVSFGALRMRINLDSSAARSRCSGFLLRLECDGRWR